MDRRRVGGVPGELGDRNIRFNGIPTARKSDGDRRKQVILSLLDALGELQDDLGGDKGAAAPRGKGPDDPGQAAYFEDQIAGAVAFEKFESRVKDLDRQLQVFPNTVMELGSSVVLMPASFALRRRLARILYLVRENAAVLFPRRVWMETESGIEHGFPHADLWSQLPSTLDARSSGAVSNELGAESFPDEIEGLARDTINFLRCLNQFPDFNSEMVAASINAFEGDLRYWASCLREFSGQFHLPSVARYVHDLSADIGERLQDITNTLVVFIENGVPIIRFVQRHGSANLLTLSTMATFFSAVTATTIQYTLDRNVTRLDAWVNAFWYSSLVFSIASAINCLIGLTWKQAMYRSPENRVPWWVRMWIKHAPLTFLVISVAAFSVGFVLFTYTSGQPRILCILITIFTGCTSCGLIAASGWLILERWAFSKHKGHVLLGDILRDLNVKLRRVSGLDWMMTVPPKQVKRAVNLLSEKSSRSYRSASRSISGLLPTYLRSLSCPACSRASSTAGDIESGPPQTISPVQQPLTSPSTFQISPGAPSASPQAHWVDSSGLLVIDPSLPSEEAASAQTTLPKDRMRRAVRSVMMATVSSGTSRARGPRPNLLEQLTAGRLARFKDIKNALQDVSISRSIMAHQSLVRNMAFSPNGKYLAACSVDRTSTIIKVADLSCHRVLAHPHGALSQVVWSPNGSMLLTKSDNVINVWTEDGVCKQRIDRFNAVHSIKWFANGTEFLSIESNDAIHLDVKGKVLDKYSFERLRLHDVAITPDGEHLLAVATLEHSKDGIKPVKARAEKRIVVYNRLTKEIESQVPVLLEVRDITISKDSRHALVSYEHKAPPQLWRIGMVNGAARLTLVHTYMSNQETRFAGPTYFGGRDDHLVFCASKAGDIHIWDREFGSLLHHIKPEEDGLTCIAWNNASDKYMFATGSLDGAVRLWHADDGDTGDSESLKDRGQVLSAGDTSAYDSSAPVIRAETEGIMLVESPGVLRRAVQYELEHVEAHQGGESDFLTQQD